MAYVRRYVPSGIVTEEVLADIEKAKQPLVKVYHYHTNHLGTPQELTNQDGDVIWLSYDRAWGGSFDSLYRQQFVDNWAVSENELQPFKFQGQCLDTETGLHYNRFRYYDSDVGMFISRDPIGLLGGSNVFQYAPNPIGWIDPWGLSSTDLGRNMRAKSGDGMANHHLIPEELMKNPKYSQMFQRLQNIGWHGDNASNGIFLPGSKSLASTMGIAGHWSNHKEYTGEIEKLLDKLNKQRRQLSDTQLALGIKEIQDHARHGLENNKFKTDPCTGRLI